MLNIQYFFVPLHAILSQNSKFIIHIMPRHTSKSTGLSTSRTAARTIRVEKESWWQVTKRVLIVSSLQERATSRFCL